MKPCIVVSILLIACAGSGAQAAVSGKCVFKGKPLAFVDAYAALAPDPFEEKSRVPTLWFTTAALDQAALARAKPDEIGDAILDQAMEHDIAKLELRFDAAGKAVEALQLYVPPGTSQSISGSSVGKAQLKAAMTMRATGRYVLDSDDDLKCDLQFDVPMAGKGPPLPAAKPWGTALPAGGGEPGTAYMAMHRAALASDIDAMLKVASKDQTEEMRKARTQPDFPKMLELIKMLEPASVTIVSGRSDGNRAELQIAGKDSDGSAMTGEVKMVREDASWRIEKVSTKSKVGN